MNSARPNECGKKLLTIVNLLFIIYLHEVGQSLKILLSNYAILTIELPVFPKRCDFFTFSTLDKDIFLYLNLFYQVAVVVIMGFCAQDTSKLLAGQLLLLLFYYIFSALMLYIVIFEQIQVYSWYNY